MIAWALDRGDQWELTFAETRPLGARRWRHFDRWTSIDDVPDEAYRRAGVLGEDERTCTECGLGDPRHGAKAFEPPGTWLVCLCCQQCGECGHDEVCSVLAEERAFEARMQAIRDQAEVERLIRAAARRIQQRRAA